MAESVTVRRMTRWWWVRHAPAVGFEGRIYGQTDVACDTSDAAAVGGLARTLPKGAIWLSSPLRRARDTAAAIQAAAGGGPDPVIEPELIEQNFGDWQGRKRSEIIRHRLWVAAADETPPGGENFIAVMARTRDAVQRLTAAYHGRDIVAVSHGGVIRSALAVALDLAPETALAFSVDNLSLTTIERFAEPGRSHDWRVAAVNRLLR